MSFELDPDEATAPAAMAEESGRQSSLAPIGEIEGRRSALNAMLERANNSAQPVSDEVEMTDFGRPPKRSYPSLLL